MQIIPIKTRKIQPKDSLLEVFTEGLKKARVKLKDGDIVAVVSKVVALTEGRLVHIGSTKDSKKNLVKLIKQESDYILNIKNGDFLLTIKNGILTPNAGIDQSNIPEGYAITWPHDSHSSAKKMRKHIQEKTRLKKIGVLIFDSCIMPLRNGVVGISLGYSGFQGVEDYRGKKDLFGKVLRVTQKNLADGLATAATIVTGEGLESTPFVIIRGASVKWKNTINMSEMNCQPKECLYKDLYPDEILGKKSAMLKK